MNTRVVWKFPLVVDDVQIIEMPANAEILCVQMQGDVPCLWARVESSRPTEPRKILIAGTGHEREDLWGLAHYIGTFQVYGGKLVFHVFEDVIYGAVSPATELVEAAVAS